MTEPLWDHFIVGWVAGLLTSSLLFIIGIQQFSKDRVWSYKK